MSIVIRFELEGEKQMIRQFRGIAADFKDWKPEFETVGTLLVNTFKDTFETQGRNIGESWPPLAESTLKQKMRRGYPSDPLIRTGKMREAFVYDAWSFEVIVTNPVSYFVYHQSKAPRKKIPRRVMMKIDQKRKEMIPKIFQKAIEEHLKERGFK